MAKNKKKGNKKKQNQVQQVTAPTQEAKVDVVVEPENLEVEQTNETNDNHAIAETQNETSSTEIKPKEEHVENGKVNNTSTEEETKPIEISTDEPQSKDNDEVIKRLTDEIKQLKEQLSLHKEDAKVDSSNESSDPNLLKELDDVKNERDAFETKYNTLLSRISSMKDVFNNMKESQQELENVKEQLVEYESQNTKMKNKLTSVNKENEELSQTVATLNKEFSTLEDDYENLQNKCDDYESEISKFESKLEDSKRLNDYKLKDSEHILKKLTTQVEEMTIILENDKQDIRDLKDEKEELQSHLANSQESTKQLKQTISELEESIQSNEKLFKEELSNRDQQINSLRVQLDNNMDVEKSHLDEITKLKLEMEKLKEDVTLKQKFEKETKDQALQIGKLRHEAIILNEHLKKALGMLKKSSDSETVDRELISNLLISFVSIPRADPKKFEVLQLLSNFLNWDDDKKQQAGLMNDPNKVQKNAPASRTQSFVSMWTEFLEKESEK